MGIGSHLTPKEALGAGVLISQLGTISDVAYKK
jgi:hypothetical protein